MMTSDPQTDGQSTGRLSKLLPGLRTFLHGFLSGRGLAKAADEDWIGYEAFSYPAYYKAALNDPKGSDQERTGGEQQQEASLGS